MYKQSIFIIKIVCTYIYKYFIIWLKLINNKKVSFKSFKEESIEMLYVCNMLLIDLLVYDSLLFLYVLSFKERQIYVTKWHGNVIIMLYNLFSIAMH